MAALCVHLTSTYPVDKDSPHNSAKHSAVVGTYTHHRTGHCKISATDRSRQRFDSMSTRCCLPPRTMIYSYVGFDAHARAHARVCASVRIVYAQALSSGATQAGAYLVEPLRPTCKNLRAQPRELLVELALCHAAGGSPRRRVPVDLLYCQESLDCGLCIRLSEPLKNVRVGALSISVTDREKEVEGVGGGGEGGVNCKYKASSRIVAIQ